VARDYVAFKGTKQGLMLWLDPQAEFSDILNELHEKLSLTREFWQGVTVVLKATERECRPEEKRRLEEIMGEFGMSLREESERVQLALRHKGKSPSWLTGTMPSLSAYAAIWTKGTSRWQCSGSR